MTRHTPSTGFFATELNAKSLEWLSAGATPLAPFFKRGQMIRHRDFGGEFKVRFQDQGVLGFVYVEGREAPFVGFHCEAA